jgi:TatD DNase family protein
MTPRGDADSPPLVDSHCHLGDPRYDEDREETIARARAAGVGAIVCVGAIGPMATNEHALELARSTPEIVVAIGIHPHDVAAATDMDYVQLRALCAADHVAAVGETGLDYHYNHSPPDVQRTHFRRTVQLARDVERPIVVHCREAFSDTRTILDEEGARAVGGVIHCFTGGPREARIFVDLGFYISVSGIVTFKNADEVRAAAAMIPDDRLLIETDGPYLAPVPHRGRRNEPAYVRHVAETVATLRGVSLDRIAQLTSGNAARLFGLRTVSA